VLLVVPEVPGMTSPKPLVQGYGARLGGGALSCEALFVAATIPTQDLVGYLHARHKPPVRVSLAWSEIPPGLYRDAEIDVRRGS
jgi:hypothetical protein